MTPRRVSCFVSILSRLACIQALALALVFQYSLIDHAHQGIVVSTCATKKLCVHLDCRIKCHTPVSMGSIMLLSLTACELAQGK